MKADKMKEKSKYFIFGIIYIWGMVLMGIINNIITKGEKALGIFIFLMIIWIIGFPTIIFNKKEVNKNV